MKAYHLSNYGSPFNLKLKDVPKPIPSEHEVLVKVMATAINDYDWSMVRGKPAIYRLFFGLFKPRRPIPGMELSGVVETMGAKASKFKAGDGVYGDTSDHGFGTFAEYICIHENALTLKPDSMPHEEATAFPHASMLAKQALDIGQPANGQSILINGAGGGMGTFAMQMLNALDVEVTGVDNGEKLQMMSELGFDHVLDYKQSDFTATGQHYDLILDAKSNRPPRHYARALKAHGKYVTVGGTPKSLIQLLLRKRFGTKRLRILGLKTNRDLHYINELYAAGKIKPILDGPHPFTDIPKLIQYFGNGEHSGKVVVWVDQADNRLA